MKNTFLAILIFLFPLTVQAQFEGTIIWNFKMEITDPKLKAQMELANSKMNSPEMKAQMQALEAKMNDPEMKALLEKNPEMKAMIEKQLEATKSGSGGSMMDNMMPKSMEIHIKNSNSLTKMIGGAFDNETLFLKDKETSYLIDRKNKTYTVLPQSKTSKTEEYKVTKTTETSTLLGYKCMKYIVETTERGQKIVNNVWATTDIKDLDPKQFSKIRIGQTQRSTFMEKIDGVPLKMIVNIPQGQMNIEIASLKKEPLSPGMFSLPAGFTEKKK
ncbi:MAG: DUF4412 domain-containing protein [Opitutaceae bacterium]|nr:DUF4412 domain-containing protein [Cytophagales bacterium]